MSKRLVLLMCLLAAPLRAGELSPELQQLLQQYKDMLELSDLVGVKKLAEAKLPLAQLLVVETVDNYFRSGDTALLEQLGPLARAMDQVEEGTRFEKRLEFAQQLDNSHRADRQAWVHQMVEANQLAEEARRESETGTWRRALATFEELMGNFSKIGDQENASYCHYKVGQCYQNLGEYLECVQALDKAMDEWLASGRSKDSNYYYMVDTRRELIEKGFDPFGGDEQASTAKNTGTSYAEGSEWQDWVTEYKKMKSATAFQTPSPLGGQNYLLWRRFDYFDDGAYPLGVISSCQPFGTQLQVVKDGSSAYLDVDGDGKGDQKVKLIDGKASAAEIRSSSEKDADAYSVFLLTQGQSVVYLGYDANRAGVGGYRPACYREAKILDQNFVFIDDNCSGSIGDPTERRDNFIHGNPPYWDNDAMLVGKGKTAGPYSDFVFIEDKLYRLKVSDALGQKIRTRELDVETGQVKLDWDGPKKPVSLVIREIADFAGAFFDVAGKKPVTVPVGKYKVAIGKIETGSKTSMKQAWILPGNGGTFEVKAGETHVLEMGGPYTVEFQTRDQGRAFTVLSKSVLLYDRSGAMIGRIYNDFPLFDVSVRSKSGTTIVKRETMRKLDLAGFLKDEVAGWYPANFEVDKGDGVPCEAQLTLKKHGLLGGPFESDWR